jgi:hypothetical protein
MASNVNDLKQLVKETIANSRSYRDHEQAQNLAENIVELEKEKQKSGGKR